MITGHLGIVGALRGLSRDRTSPDLLLALLFAAVLPDVLDVSYVVVGFCNPFGLYSHTLYAVVLEAALLGGLAFLATQSAAATLTIVLVLLLHVPADLLTGHKLFLPGGELVGLHLYARPALDWLLEVPLLALGWWMLRRRGVAPAWAISTKTVALLVAVQSGFAWYGFTHPIGLKPTACTQASSLIEPLALVGGGRARHVSGVLLTGFRWM